MAHALKRWCDAGACRGGLEKRIEPRRHNMNQHSVSIRREENEIEEEELRAEDFEAFREIRTLFNNFYVVVRFRNFNVFEREENGENDIHHSLVCIDRADRPAACCSSSIRGRLQ